MFWNVLLQNIDRKVTYCPSNNKKKNKQVQDQCKLSFSHSGLQSQSFKQTILRNTDTGTISES